jgi:hypothetical protein
VLDYPDSGWSRFYELALEPLLMGMLS